MPLTSRVIIVNYNSGPWLQRAIASVLEHSDSVISVVDNASQDTSFTDAQDKIKSPRVDYIANLHNVGFAAANNQVLNNLDTDLAILMNPDCEINASTLPPILSFFADTNQSIGYAAASCRILNADGSNQKTSRRRFPTPASALARMIGLHKLGLRQPWAQDFDFGGNATAHEKIQDVPAISGAYMVMTNSALNQIGLLDDDYFMHCEDLDWCKRCELAGLRIAYIPEASVLHAKGVSSSTRPIGVLWNLHTGMARFFKKFYQKSHGLWFTGLVQAGIYASFLLRVVVNLSTDLLRWFANIFRGRH